MQKNSVGDNIPEKKKKGVYKNFISGVSGIYINIEL